MSPAHSQRRICAVPYTVFPCIIPALLPSVFSFKGTSQDHSRPDFVYTEDTLEVLGSQKGAQTRISTVTREGYRSETIQVKAYFTLKILASFYILIYFLLVLNQIEIMVQFVLFSVTPTFFFFLSLSPSILLFVGIVVPFSANPSYFLFLSLPSFPPSFVFLSLSFPKPCVATV